MTITTFDTLEYSKSLQDAGMERNQADAFARVQAKAMADLQSSLEKHNEIGRKELATKGDLQDVREELKKDIQDVRNELANTKHEILKWVVGIAFTQTAIIIAMIGIGVAVLKP